MVVQCIHFCINNLSHTTYFVEEDLALMSPHEIAQGHQPQRVAGCGSRAGGGLALRPNCQIWLDISVDIDHKGCRAVANMHCSAEAVDLETKHRDS